MLQGAFPSPSADPLYCCERADYMDRVLLRFRIPRERLALGFAPTNEVLLMTWAGIAALMGKKDEALDRLSSLIQAGLIDRRALCDIAASDLNCPTLRPEERELELTFVKKFSY
jgi:hypothetical protein